MSLDAAHAAADTTIDDSSFRQHQLNRIDGGDFSTIRMEQTEHIETMHSLGRGDTTASLTRDQSMHGGSRRSKKDWRVPSELLLSREEKTASFGIAFKGKRKMMLKNVDDGACSDPDKAEQFIGRRLMTFNGRYDQDCTNIEKYKRLECCMEFAWPIGYPVRLWFDDEQHPCVVRDADDARYVITGRDELGIWDVSVPYKRAADLIEEGDPTESYVVSQELQLLTESRVYVPVKVLARTTKGYKVAGKMGTGRDGKLNEFTKLVKYYDAPRLLQPRLFSKVEFKDPVTQKFMRFVGMASEKNKLLCSIDDVPQVNKVEDVKWKHLLTGDVIHVGARGLGLAVHLPQGEQTILSNLRLICSVFEVKNNVPNINEVVRTSFEPHRSNESEMQELVLQEKTARQGIRNHENQAARHLCLVFRRIRINIHFNTPSIGIRCNKRPPLIVQEVIAGSPADDAGIRKGDMIISLETPNGLWKCYSREQLISVLGPRGFVYGGTMVRFDICRDQEVIEHWADMFQDERPQLPTRLPTNFHHAVALDFACRLPLPEEIVYCYVLAEVSRTHRDRIIHNLIPIADVYSQEMDYEYAADLIENEEEFNAYCDDCSEATIGLFEDDPVTKAEAFHLHRYMMEGFGLPPLDQADFERHFKDAAAFWNTYELPYEEVVSPLLRDFMVEVFSSLSAKAQKQTNVGTKAWRMRSDDSSGSEERERARRMSRRASRQTAKAARSGTMGSESVADIEPRGRRRGSKDRRRSSVSAD